MNIKKIDKNFFRKSCLKRLKKVSNFSKLKKDKEVSKRVEFLVNEIKPKAVLLYMPLKSEIDLRELIKKLRKKMIITVPLMEGVSFKMVKYRLPIRESDFKIKEPPNSFFRFFKIDLAIVPVVGVDRDFGRIGFGKGMYDRFFDGLGYAPKIVFVQIEKCYTKHKITQKHDIKADFFITPKEFIIRGNKNGNRVNNRRRMFSIRRRRRLFGSQKIKCGKL